MKIFEEKVNSVSANDVSDLTLLQVQLSFLYGSSKGNCKGKRKVLEHAHCSGNVRSFKYAANSITA